MARVLIVGCGCRGRALARALMADGHAVRGTSRTPAGLERIRAEGPEAVRADPDLIATLMPALEGVTILCWLLGGASGTREKVAALHSGRLRMLFEKLADSPVRGVLYEPLPGHRTADRARGLQVVADARRTWAMPIAEVGAGGAPRSWLPAARTAVADLLTPPAHGR